MGRKSKDNSKSNADVQRTDRLKNNADQTQHQRQTQKADVGNADCEEQTNAYATIYSTQGGMSAIMFPVRTVDFPPFFAVSAITSVSRWRIRQSYIDRRMHAALDGLPQERPDISRARSLVSCLSSVYYCTTRANTSRFTRRVSIGRSHMMV